MRPRSLSACILVMSAFLLACGLERIIGAIPTPAPTYTSPPTQTAYPTYTPYPTYTFIPTSTSSPTPFSTATSTPTQGSSSPALNVRARIDGVSYLVVKGNTLRWYHQSFTAPGRWVEASTYVNGVQWDPTWPDVPDRRNVDCKCYSSFYEGIPAVANFPPLTLEVVQARGKVTITQQPDPTNDYTLLVEFDDVILPDTTYGDEWYEINLLPTNRTFPPTSTPTVIAPDDVPGLVLHFDDSLVGTGSEQGFASDVMHFVPGHSGQGALFDREITLYYLTGNNISPGQGAISFWLQPLWNGSDNQDHVFFDIGDSWFNHFQLIKDAANNFKFMVWSSKAEYGVACGVGHWLANDWHQVKAAWKDGTISLYLDDNLCSTQSFVTMPSSLASRFYIGSFVNGNAQAQSVIDEFTISTKSP